MKKTFRKLNIEKFDILIFTIVTIVFTLAWVAFSPAIMTSDSVGQLEQAYNNSYTNAHPVFHSFLIGSITKIFNTVSAVSIFQILIFAVLWAICCKNIRDKKTSIKTKIFQLCITIIISITPINFMYSITLWKDILYSYSILSLVLCIYIGIKNEFNYSYFQMIITSISCVLIMKFRHNGIPIGIIMFGILLICNGYRNYKLKNVIKSLFFILIFITILLISYIPQFLYCNPGNTLNASSAFTTTQICSMGYLLKTENIELEKNEYEIINSILSVDILEEISDPYWSTAIIYNENFNKNYLNEHTTELNDIFFKYAKQYPKAMLKYFAKANSTAWSISVRSWTHTIFEDNNGITEISKGEYETNPKSQNLNNLFRKYIDVTGKNKFIYTILYRPSIYMYVSLTIGIIVSIKRKKLSYLLLLVPMILNIGTYIPFIISQEVRYLYPNFLTLYFIVLLCGNITKKDRDRKEKINLFDKKYSKYLIIIPAYNEEKSIKKVVTQIYRETKDCDIVVINDGSQDNTYKEAKKTKAVVINLPNNLGIGGAVQTGYLYAYKNNYDIAIQVDADGQHNPKYIPEMINIIQKGQADMVIGSRFIEKMGYKQTFFRMLGINITSKIIKMLTGRRIFDTTSGFRAVNKEIIEEFSYDYPYDYPEPCTNMKMILKNKIVKEIPVEMNLRTTGVSSISPLKSIKYMVKVILSLLIMKIKKN